MNITQPEKIELIMTCFPNTYLFRGKPKTINDQQIEALSYCIYLMLRGWGKFCATNRSGDKHKVSVQFLRRMINNHVPQEILEQKFF